MRTNRVVCAVVVALASASAVAAEYHCTVEKKVTPERDYSAADLAKEQPSVRIEETKDGAKVHRCGWSPSQNAVTCDEIEIDRVEVEPYIKAKKFYNFWRQYNVQLFANLSFVEDVGRGLISFGTCKLVAP